MKSRYSLFRYVLILIFALLTDGAGKEPALDFVPPITTLEQIPNITSDDLAALARIRQMYPRGLIYGMQNTAECFLAPDNKLYGFTPRFCQYLSQLLGMPITPQIFEWDDLIAGLRSQKIAFTGELTPTAKRAASGWIMSEPITWRAVSAFRLNTSRTLAEVRAAAEPEKIRAAFLNDTITYAQVSAHLGNNLTPIFVNNHSEVYPLLKAHKIDFFFNETAAAASFAPYPDIRDEIFYPLLYEPVSLSTYDSAFVPIIKVVNRLLADNSGVKTLDQLYFLGNREYQHQSLLGKLSPGEIAYIAQHNTPETAIKVAFEYDSYPISFYNQSDREYQGIAADVLKQISAITGLKFAPVPETPTEFSDLLKILRNGDAAMISKLIPTDDRRTNFLFPTHSYMRDFYALITTNDFHNIGIHEFHHLRIGVQSGTAYEDYARQFFRAHPAIITYETVNEMLTALEKHEIDAVFSSQAFLAMANNYLQNPQFRLNFSFAQYSNPSFGFNLRETALRTIIDAVMPQIDLNAIENLWLTRSFDYRSKIAANHLARAIVIVIVAALLSSFLGLMVYLQNRSRQHLRKLINHRTQELLVQTEAAETALSQAQLASHAKSVFLAQMSHELRTPLNAIIGMSRVAQKQDIPADAMAALAALDASAWNLLGILNNILDMQKIESGRISLNVEPFLLIAAMREVADIIRHSCAEKRIIYRDDLDQHPEITVLGDRTRLNQVLINLLGNAVKYTLAGGKISLSVNTEISSEQSAAQLTFTITDTGIGMTSSQVSRLFQMFQISDSYSTAGGGGCGLGLAISQEILRLMGSNITVLSEPGVGSTFTFELSLKIAELPEDSDATIIIPPDLSGKRALIVDDVDINRIVLMDLLAETGLAMEEAADGSEALEKFRKSPENYYAVIFLDIQMPKMNGYTAAQEIRQLSRKDSAKIPLIAVTAYAYQQDIAKSLAAGMNAHLPKPINQADLMHTLESLFAPVANANTPIT